MIKLPIIIYAADTNLRKREKFYKKINNKKVLYPPSVLESRIVTDKFGIVDYFEGVTIFSKKSLDVEQSGQKKPNCRQPVCREFRLPGTVTSKKNLTKTAAKHLPLDKPFYFDIVHYIYYSDT